MNRHTFQYHLISESIITYSQSIEAPLQKVGNLLIAPSTMPIIFWQIANVPWLDKEKTYIHGRQSFTYKAPLKAGSLLDCELSLAKLEKKTGKRGNLILYTHLLICKSKGEPLVTAETVLISIGDPS